MGFQLFCDDRMVLTAGGGGGGGIEGSPRRGGSSNDASFHDNSNDNDNETHTDSHTSGKDDNEGFNFGGGGGGGLQFDIGIVRFHAIDEMNSTTLNTDLTATADRSSDRSDLYANRSNPDVDPDQNMRIDHIQPAHRWQWESKWVSMGGGGGCGTYTSDSPGSKPVASYSNTPSNTQSNTPLSSISQGYNIICGERCDDNSSPTHDNNNTPNTSSNTTLNTTPNTPNTSYATSSNTSFNTTNSSNTTTTSSETTANLALVQMQTFLHTLSQVCVHDTSKYI